MINRVILAVLLISVGMATVVPHLGKVKSHVPNTYRVNLEDPLQKRWEKIIYDYRHALKLFMDYFELLPIPQPFWKVVEWYADNVFLHQDFADQVRALSKVSGHPFPKLFFLNFMYEFSTLKECSGILIRDQNNKIMHGRNLDFFAWDLLAKLVVKVDYYKAGKPLYSVDTVVGSVFALTGIRFGAFAINVDTRKVKGFYHDWVNVLMDNAMPDVWLLRRVLAEQDNFNDAVERLKTTRIGGPVYYVVSGLKGNEGAVIERDSDGVHGFYTLNSTTWFLVQTNYDRDQPDPRHDPRRIPVENRIRERGQGGFTEKVLFEDFMTVWPTFNIATIMTTVMIPSASYHNTTVWYASNPSIESSI